MGLTEGWICGVDVVIFGALLDGEFLEFMLMEFLFFHVFILTYYRKWHSGNCPS